jgi:hypothetical protein
MYMHLYIHNLYYIEQNIYGVGENETPHFVSIHQEEWPLTHHMLLMPSTLSSNSVNYQVAW